MIEEIGRSFAMVWAIFTIGFMGYANYVWYGLDFWHKPVKRRMRWLSTGTYRD